jgi:hypothetical protein
VPLADGQYLATVRASLSIRLDDGDPRGHVVNRSGVGADVAKDPDKAYKTAQAEALKKAANQFGVALELWTEEGREVVARGRALESGDLSVLKQELFRRALEKGAEPTPESVAETMGLTVEDLQDADKIKETLDA